MTRETDLIEKFVKERLGEEYKGINFVPNFTNFDMDIVILTETRGFIKFPVDFTRIMDTSPEEAHEYIRNGLAKAIEKHMEKDDRPREN